VSYINDSIVACPSALVMFAPQPQTPMGCSGRCRRDGVHRVLPEDGRHHSPTVESVCQRICHSLAYLCYDRSPRGAPRVGDQTPRAPWPEHSTPIRVSRQRAGSSMVEPHDGRLMPCLREGRGCVLCGGPWLGVVSPPSQAGGEGLERSLVLYVTDAGVAVTWCIPAEMSLRGIRSI